MKLESKVLHIVEKRFEEIAEAETLVIKNISSNEAVHTVYSLNEEGVAVVGETLLGLTPPYSERDHYIMRLKSRVGKQDFEFAIFEAAENSYNLFVTNNKQFVIQKVLEYEGSGATFDTFDRSVLDNIINNSKEPAFESIEELLEFVDQNTSIDTIEKLKKGNEIFTEIKQWEFPATDLKIHEINHYLYELVNNDTLSDREAYQIFEKICIDESHYFLNEVMPSYIKLDYIGRTSSFYFVPKNGDERDYQMLDKEIDNFVDYTESDSYNWTPLIATVFYKIACDEVYYDSADFYLQDINVDDVIDAIDTVEQEIDFSYAALKEQYGIAKEIQALHEYLRHFKTRSYAVELVNNYL